MRRRTAVSLIVAVATAVLLAACWLLIVVNPFEWWAETSHSFTWEEFGRVRRGDPIARVVDALGDPIEPPSAYEGPAGNESTRVCSEAGRCRLYQFAGIGLGGGREAIVIVDAQRGIVLDKRVNHEP